jgi:hypothetical protein
VSDAQQLDVKLIRAMDASTMPDCDVGFNQSFVSTANSINPELAAQTRDESLR